MKKCRMKEKKIVRENDNTNKKRMKENMKK